MDVFDLVAKISINDSEYERGLNNASSKNSILSASTVAMGQLMADAFSKVISKVSEYGQKIIEVGAEQETALAKVNTIMDTSVMSTEKMSKGIKDLSGEMGISVSELSDSVYNVISATGDTKNALSLAEKASKLATAGFTDTGSAVGVLTTAMNAYHLSADEATHISDSLIQVQNLGVTTVGELASSMGKAIASASAYGVNLENLESAYISITKAGISTAEGTTYISSMLKELGDSGSDVSGILQEKTGKSFDQLLGEGKSLGDVLEILNKSVDGDATALMNLWSSAEAGKASSAILGQGITQFNDNLKSLQETTGTTQTAYETMADTFEHKTEVIKTKLENFGAGIFDRISPQLSKGLDFVTKLFKDNSEKIEDFVDKTVSGAIALFENAKQYIQPVYEFIVDIFNRIVAGFNTAKASLDTEDLIRLFNNIKEAIGKILDKVTELKDNVAPSIETIVGVFNTLVDILNAILESQTAIDVIVSLAEAVGIVIGVIKAWEIAQTALNLVLTLNPIGIVIMAITALIAIVILLVKHWDEVSAGAKACWEAIKEAFGHLGEWFAGIWEKIKDVFKGIGDWFKEKFESARDAVKNAWDGINDWFSEKWEAIKEIFANAKEKFKEIGKNIISGIKKGITDAWDSFKSWLMDKFSGIIDGVKDVFGIHSPSKAFSYIGEMCVKGLEEGSDELFSDEGMTAKVSASVKASTSGSDNKIDALIDLLEEYLPNMATRDSFNNIGISVNNREFGRLVNGVI